MNSKKFIVGGLACLFIGVVFIALFLPIGNNKAQNIIQANSETNKTPQKPALQLIDQAVLQQSLENTINANPGLDIGVSVHDLGTDQSYTYGVDVPFIAASVGKLITASLYLKNVENGINTLEEPYGDSTARVQIQRMIGKSDNTAWHLLNDELGHPALVQYANQNGIASYDADKNTIKPSDVSLLLTKLYNRQLLNEDNTSFLLANMQIDQEEVKFIRNYIDPSIAVYH
ncbi:MAG: serine hydrolase, partial [Bdellovibrionales bacterium]